MVIKLALIFVAALSAYGALATEVHDGGTSKPVPDHGLHVVAPISYREAYSQMLIFDKYAKPKQFVQNNFLVTPKGNGLSLKGLSLMLIGDTIKLDLQIDAVGRITLPLSKVAYKENAKFFLNRESSLYTFKFELSIIPRIDGIYDADNLKTACTQILDYLRDRGQIEHGQNNCVGVRFSFAKSNVFASVKFKSAENLVTQMQMRDGVGFSDGAMPILNTTVYRFAAWPRHGQILLQSMPSTIAPVFE